MARRDPAHRSGVAFGLIVSLAGAWLSRADDEPRAKDDEMRRHAQVVRVESVSGGQSSRAEMVPEALLRFDDPARSGGIGSLWAWGTPGRPLAILELAETPRRPESFRWVHGMTSLSSGLIAATWDDGRKWESIEPGLVPRPIPDAPAPAATERERLVQMKDLARRFAVREDAGKIQGTIQLRLLPNPIHRYADPASGLQDGAIFVFAYGTNPEALLLIESRSTGGASPTWQYGLGRVTGGALTVELGGKEVWTQPAANPPYTGAAYMNRRHRALAGPK